MAHSISSKHVEKLLEIKHKLAEQVQIINNLLKTLEKHKDKISPDRYDSYIDYFNDHRNTINKVIIEVNHVISVGILREDTMRLVELSMLSMVDVLIKKAAIEMVVNV